MPPSERYRARLELNAMRAAIADAEAYGRRFTRNYMIATVIVAIMVIAWAFVF